MNWWQYALAILGGIVVGLLVIYWIVLPLWTRWTEPYENESERD